jgi:hypothetical protein
LAITCGTFGSNNFGMAWTACQDAAVDDTDQVDRYLQHLGLTELRLEHFIERVLSAGTDEQRRWQLRQFWDAFGRMQPLITAENREDWERYLSLAEEWAIRFADVVPPNVRFQLLQQRFAWMEQQYYDRWRWRGDAKSLARWPLELLRLATDIREARAELNRQRDPLIELNEIKNESMAATAGAQRQISQLIYWEAWLAYFRATSVAEESAEQTRAAISSFRELLDLPPGQKLIELPKNWFDLRTEPWHWRAVLGLGLACRAAGQDLEAEWCFQQLELVDRAGDAALSATYWNLCSFMWAARYPEAMQFLNRHLDAQRPLSERLTWWLACLRGARLSVSQDIEVTRRLVDVGLLGLIRDEQKVWLVREWTDLATLPAALEGSFIGRWAQVIVAMQAAETSGDIAAWQDCQRRFRELEPSIDRQLTRDDQWLFRSQRALCLYQVKLWPEAVAQAEQACAGWITSRADRAAAMAWLAAQAQLSQIAQQPQAVAVARQALLRLQQNFPETAFAARAELELWRLDRVHNTENQPDVAPLPAAVYSPQHPAYAEALVLRATDLHRRALALQQRLVDGASEPNAAAARNAQTDLAEQWEQLHRESLSQTGRLSSGQQLRIEVLRIDTALRWKASMKSPTALTDSGTSPFVWWNHSGAWRDMANRLVELRRRLPPQSAAMCDCRYYEWILAEKNADEPASEEHRLWLLQFGQDTEFYGAALAQQADKLFGLWQADPANPEVLQQAVGAHNELRSWLENRQTNQSREQLARVDRRLADWAERSGKWDTAEQIYERLLPQFPDDMSLLMRAGRVKIELRQWPSALSLWRRVVSGAIPGSAEWLEAKWSIVICLRPSECEQARAIWQQTIDLYPDMPEPWLTKFRDLQW